MERKKERKLKLKCGRELAKAQGYLSIYLSSSITKRQVKGRQRINFIGFIGVFEFSFVLYDLKMVVFKEQLKVVLHVFHQKTIKYSS